MKFIASSAALLKQLSSVNGVITSNPVVPILENFLFEITEGKLKITASDLQTSMITEIEVESKESGNIAIPARILLDTLKNLPEQPVTFTVDEDTYGVELSCDNGRYKLAGENATDFPKVPSVSDGDTLDIASHVLNRAITNTIFAASNDELRPAMTGIYISINDSSITFVATDGHRLVRFRRVDVASEDSNSLIIPRKALNLLKSTLPSDNTNPVENPNLMKVQRADFLNSLKRISIYANKTTHQVRLKIAGSELQISAEDLDFSNEANEKLGCEYGGEDIEIGFNAKFLMEMVSNLDSDELTLKLSEPNRAGLLVPADADENEDVLMLVMPVMLNNYV